VVKLRSLERLCEKALRSLYTINFVHRQQPGVPTGFACVWLSWALYAVHFRQEVSLLLLRVQTNNSMRAPNCRQQGGAFLHSNQPCRPIKQPGRVGASLMTVCTHV
jgi:hypothetical protein